MVEMQNLTRFSEVFERVTRVFTCMEHFCGNMDMSKPEIMALESILKYHDLKMSELAINLHISFSAATKIIDRLIEKNMVTRERKNDDRRIVKVMLTEKGRKMVLAYQKQKTETFERLLGMLTAEEQEHLIAIMEKIAGIGIQE